MSRARRGQQHDPAPGLERLWVEDMRARARSAVTIRNRTLFLDRLRRGVPESTPIGVSRAAFEQWADARRAELTPDSFRAEMTHARAWFRWLVQCGYRPDDPSAAVILPTPRRRQPRPLKAAAFRTVLERAGDVDRVLLMLAWSAGLRAKEIASLEWQDIDLDEGVLLVRHGKGDRERMVPISSELADLLRATPRRSPYVVPRRDGRPGPLKPNGISAWASELLGGKGAGGTLHQLRHSFGTQTYQATQDLRVVQELLGHASPSTTAIYAAGRSDLARKAVEAMRLRPSA